MHSTATGMVVLAGMLVIGAIATWLELCQARESLNSFKESMLCPVLPPISR
ncbi:hypothetical protein SBC2_17830 [Caballeronia sp. SBC2]|nr:hypothetical protein SBC2_17830 [Caballeronia sp. SBC2]